MFNICEASLLPEYPWLGAGSWRLHEGGCLKQKPGHLGVTCRAPGGAGRGRDNETRVLSSPQPDSGLRTWPHLITPLLAV